MIRSSSLFGMWLIIAGAGLAQTQPATPTQTQTPPVTAPPNSPAIITLPPSTPASDAKPPEFQPPVPANSKAAKAAGTKGGAPKSGGANQLDPAGVPSKDPTAIGSAYVIGPEDFLFIRVWKSPEFSGTVSVGPDGMISLQLINEVKAAGLTARQLADVLADRLKEFLTTPEVNVQVMAARSRTYIILGDGVLRPGIYPLPKPLTVLEALIAGGAFSPFAKKNKIYILRGTQKFSFNWNEVSKGKKPGQNILIQNGDKIYVP